MFTLGGVRRRRRSCRSCGAACARGGRSSREPVPLALVSLVRRNRRRYGGYFVHIGIITLFVGVAASSSFKDVQDVALQPGPDRADRRLRVHLRQADRRAARGRQRPAGADRARRAAERAQGRRQAAAAAHVEGLLPVAGPDARPGLALLRRRVDDRGRARREPAQRHLGRGRARTSRSSARGSTRATGCSTRPPTTSRVEQSNEFLALALKRADRQLRAEPAARALPASRSTRWSPGSGSAG